MSKYDGLGEYLRKHGGLELPMTFQEIERVAGEKLPASAYKYRPWWSNNPANNVLTKVWLGAGYRTERVDMAGKRLVFKRVIKSPGPALSHQRGSSAPSVRHPLIGCMKGTFWIDPEWDPSQPAMPEWADLVDAKYEPDKTK